MRIPLMILASLALVGGALVVVGCGSPPPPKPPASPAQVVDTRAPAAPPGTTPAGSGLAVGDDILKACAIKVSSPENAPKFDLDSADVAPDERDVLQQIATCLTTGPLKGRAVLLTGRADPRGEREYNMSLGAGRAKNVAFYLTRLGVEATRMKETSRGELDATGTDEATWRKDRRVDITLQ